jgi:hypothetical protein
MSMKEPRRPAGEQPPGDQPGRPTRARRWAPRLAAAAIAAAAATVALVAVGCGDASQPAADASTNASNPTTEFATAIRAPVGRLTDSAQVTGRRLVAADAADDITGIARMAHQQLAVVQQAQARIAGIPATGPESTARGTLARAAQAHRTFLASLARLDRNAEATPDDQVGRLRSQAHAALRQYRRFFVLVPDTPRGVATAGLAELAGVKLALEDRQRQQVEAEDEGAPVIMGEPADAAPEVSNIATTDRGGFVEISTDYCDRTPGTVNDFVYTFRIVQGGTVLAEDSYTASQTRACNHLYQSFIDDYPLGTYEVQVIVDNLTNQVSGSAAGTLTVIN